MKCVSYTRSTSIYGFEGKDLKTIGAQNETITDYAKNHGIKILKKYSDRKYDSDERRGFDELLADGMNRQFDCIIVDSIDFAANNLWVAKEIYLQTFYYAGLHFIVVEDMFNSFEKDHKEVEDYFNQKYREYKSRLLSHRDVVYHKEHPKLVKTSKPPKNCFKQVRSDLRFKVFDGKSGKQMNIRKIKGVSYFTVIDENNKYGTDSNCRIQVDRVEQMALLALQQEKNLAINIRELLLAEESKNHLDEQLERIGKEMRVHFENIIDKKISVENAEEGFLKMTDEANFYEKAFSVKNQWICNMLKIPELNAVTKPIVKKFVDKFVITGFNSLTIMTFWNDWKMVFPKEWLIING